MALTERQVVDKIEVLENNVIQIRTATVIEKDGAELTRSFHRHAVVPGQDVAGEDQRVQDIVNVLWTQQVIDDYAAWIDLQSQSIE